jgi:hypothetical protein
MSGMSALLCLLGMLLCCMVLSLGLAWWLARR